MKKNIKLLLGFIIIIFHIVMLSKFSVKAVELNPKLNIETPVNNISVNEDIKITGWSINSTGIKDVNILLDGVQIGKADIGISRLDVYSAFPTYKDSSKSGFEYLLDIDNLSIGSHSVLVQAVGNNGIKLEKSLVINRTNNLIPKMVIENPSNNEILKSNIKITGWSINQVGIREINILLDGVQIGKSNIGINRLDVYNAFPSYKDSLKSGFEYLLDINKVSNGTHFLVVQALGNDGTKLEKGITISKPEKLIPKMVIEGPSNKEVIKNNIKISGWSINSVGIKEINVLLDGKQIGKTNAVISRIDVYNAFPDYKDSSKSGFEYLLDIANLSPGKHVISVQSVGNDDSTLIENRTIDIQKLPSKMFIDNITNVLSYSQADIKIEGWALNASGVKELNVYIDDKAIGKFQQNISRPDVKNALPEYPNGLMSGFNYTIDKSLIPLGSHKLTIESVGYDGTKFKVERTSERLIANPRLVIDSPTLNSSINSTDIVVEGWALNDSGVSVINILVDGQLDGSTKVGIGRIDVANAYPNYREANISGYKYLIDINKYKPGIHSITVQALGNDGNKVESSININLVKPNSKTFVESVYSYDTRKNGVLIEGWSVNHSGVKKVEIYLDDQLDGVAEIGIARFDVGNIYPTYNNSKNSGFRYILDSTKVKNGLHTIKIISTGNDGTTNQDLRIVDIANDSLIYVDYSKSYEEALNKQIQVGAQTDKTGKWTSATKEDIEKYLNPINFMDDYGKYQFLRLSFTYGVSAEDINKLLVGKGVLQGKGQVFLDAAKSNNISPLYLVSHALLETGNGTSELANGILVSQTNKLIVVTDKDANGSTIGYHVELNPNPTDVQPKISYNVFGIRAYDYNPRELKSPQVFASEYAYNQGWFSVDDAIRLGAKWIADGYINSSTYAQNTLYEMRWNPQTPGTHQYASDVAWAYKQISNIKKLADQCPNAVLVFEMPRYKSAPLLGKTIVLDAGHGGKDPGATGNGYQEKNLNIQVVEKLANNLKDMGASILYTREPSKDEYSDLDVRATFGNNANADLFLSIHHDSSTDSSASGTSTHYSSYRPALDTQDAYVQYNGKKYPFVKEEGGFLYYNDNGIIKSVNINNATAYDPTPTDAAQKSETLAAELVEEISSLGIANKGSRDHNLYVTRWTQMPSVLVEVGFISNAAEVAKIAATSFQEQLAQRIADVIRSFFTG